MTPEAIREVVPLGVAGLAILAVVVIAALNLNRWWTLAIPLAAVLALVGVDKLYPNATFEPAGRASPALSGTTSAMAWVDTGMKADWAGRDWAYTSGSLPRYAAPNSTSGAPEPLCDANHAYYIAVCWEARPGGYPRGVTVTDIKAGATPAQWCTYKTANINLGTRLDGGAPAGRVYICAQAVPR
jgi:hypothetical protein